MTLVGFAAARSCGVTTTVLALARAWTDGGALIAELDAAGGSLALRHDLRPEPGLTTLAAAARRGLSASSISQHCQRLSDGTPVLLGPVGSEQASSALDVLGIRLVAQLDALEELDVLADLGRLDARRSPGALLAAVDHLVLVLRPSLEGVAQARACIEELGIAPQRLAVVCIGDRPYRASEAAAALGAPLVGVLPDDPRAALRLGAPGRDRRSTLVRPALEVAGRLQRAIAQTPQGATSSTSRWARPGPSAQLVEGRR